MIDLDITLKRLEDLKREVERIEFSHSFIPEMVEQSIKCRRELEPLIEMIGWHLMEEDCEDCEE